MEVQGELVGHRQVVHDTESKVATLEKELEEHKQAAEAAQGAAEMGEKWYKAARELIHAGYPRFRPSSWDPERDCPYE